MDEIDLKFPKLINDSLIKTAFGIKTKRVPIFIHRQAGRHLPEYIKSKGNTNFFDLCKNPDLVCEITIQPVNRYEMDAAIIFSDILTIPLAIGFDIKMIKGKGPVILNPIEIDSLNKINFNVNFESKLNYVYKAITKTRMELKGKVPLIGFSGGPFTLLTYLIEGTSSKAMNKTRKFLFEHVNESKFLLNKLTDCIINHCLLQIKNGAQMIEIFDTLVGALSPDTFKEYIIPLYKRISHDLKRQFKVPIAIFPKGANDSLDEISLCGFDVISIDWKIDPRRALELVNGNVVLMGNLDPCSLFSNEKNIIKETEKLKDRFGDKPFIANLGHGVLPDTSPDKVSIFVKTVHSNN